MLPNKTPAAWAGLGLNPERRFLALDADTRVDDDEDGALRFSGHAAVFDERVWIGPPKFGFYEVIRAGAFAKTINESDVRMLLNHDPNLPLARNTIAKGPGSLRLREDKKGLKDDAEWLDTSYALDLAKNIRAGIISQQSFAFLAVKEAWSTDDDGNDERELLEAKLFDVSPVTYPAYTGTDGAMRGLGFELLVDALALDPEQEARFAKAIRSGRIHPDLLPAFRAAREALDALVAVDTPEPAQPATPGVLTDDPVRSRQIRRAMTHLEHLLDL